MWSPISKWCYDRHKQKKVAFDIFNMKRGPRNEGFKAHLCEKKFEKHKVAINEIIEYLESLWITMYKEVGPKTKKTKGTK